MTSWVRRLLLTLLCLPVLAEADSMLVAGGDHDFPPYEFIDESGQPAGLNVELIQAVARKLGREVEIRLGPWEDSRRAITSGEIDLLSMYRADFRSDEVQFATPHVIIYHEIFIRTSNAPLIGVAGLHGREVIVQRDAWVHEQLIDLGIAADLILVETERDALKLLAEGRHDAALLSEIVGRRLAAELGLDNLTTSGPPLFPVEYGLAVTAGRDTLLAEVDRALERIKLSGEFNQLHQRWLGHATARQPAPRGATPVAAVILTAILTLMLAGAIWWVLHGRKLAEVKAQVTHHWHEDAVTGLPNRFGLERKLQQIIARSGPERMYALLHLDMDQFRLVNAHGDYRMGDDILVQVGRLLSQRLSQDCFLARPGGDEFALICPVRDRADAVARADQLRQALPDQPLTLGDIPVQLTASIGICLIDSEALQVGDVIKHAELACLVAKEAGRNRVHLYHTEDEAISTLHGQMRWIGEIDQAFKNDNFELYFQTLEPTVPSADQALRIELLLRMTASDGRLVSAGEFVPAAERYFLAHRLDRRVLRMAFGWLERHAASLPQLKRVFINLSARSLADDRFGPFVLELFETHAVSPKLIGFEITETAVMTHLDNALDTLKRLRAIGCTLALDDFGVGSSSMAYLKQLPVDVLKIDGRFSKLAASDECERAMLAEIHALGHMLGKITVAEMIEDDHMRQVMAEIGIDYVQGWGISKPRPLDDLLNR
jgi:diguanylate cyclase (GGDEF)-like protein